MVILALAALLAGPLEVPFVAQQKDTCGAAALAMVLRHWGVEASQDEIARRLVRRELRGIRGSDLEAYARERGLVAVAHRGDLGHLRAHLARGRPSIVAWDMGRGRLHDVVVVGIDDASGHVIVHDPARGAGRRVDGRTFEKRWAAAGYWTLLVVPRG